MSNSWTIETGPGRTLHGVTEGEGPNVLLLHGALATSKDWLAGPFQQLVAAGFRVSAIDRPGHGSSRRPRFEGTPRDQGRQIRAGLDQLGIERPVIVGHSYGALVSLAYADQFPEEVSALVLVAPLAFPEPRLVEHMLLAPRSMPFFGPMISFMGEATIDLPAMKLLQRLMFSPQPVPAVWEETFPYDTLLNVDAMVFQGEDAAAILPFAPAGIVNVASIKTPTIILSGKADHIIEFGRQAKQLAPIMPNAALWEADYVGHMLHHARTDMLLDALKQATAGAPQAPARSFQSSRR